VSRPVHATTSVELLDYMLAGDLLKALMEAQDCFHKSQATRGS
jgi:hypothetical protein